MTPPPAWRIVGASVIGSSHQARGRGCDDAHATARLAGEVFLLCVADGAGSAAHAAEGSATVTSTAIATATEQISRWRRPPTPRRLRQLLRTTVTAARAALEERAAGDGAPPLRAYATTFLFAILTPSLLAAIQVGDGAIVLQEADGSIVALIRPDHTDYINEVHFLTSKNYADHLQQVVRDADGVRAVALFTDGVEELGWVYATNQPHAPFFSRIFATTAAGQVTNEELAAFLASPAVCAKTEDDKTLVLAVRA